MINFNTNDYNMDKIEKLARINKFKTDYDYRIYGLRDEEKNPLVLIEFNYDMLDGEITDYHRNVLTKFFNINGISLKFNDLSKEEDKKVWLGIKYDLRKDVTISANIVQTIIYFLQGKINLEAYSNVPGIPKLYRRGKKYNK